MIGAATRARTRTLSWDSYDHDLLAILRRCGFQSAVLAHAKDRCVDDCGGGMMECVSCQDALFGCDDIESQRCD